MLKNGEEHFGEITEGPERVDIVTIGGRRLSFKREEVEGLQSLSEPGKRAPSDPGASGDSASPTVVITHESAPAGAPSRTDEGAKAAGSPAAAGLPWYERHKLLLGLGVAAVCVVIAGLLAARGRSRDDSTPRRRPTEKDFKGGGGSGCLWVIGILLLLVGGAALYVWLQWRTWAADTARETAETLIAQSDMTDIDKARVRKRISLVIADFEAERIGSAELERLAQTFSQGPMMAFALHTSVGEVLRADRQLKPEERADGQRVMERWARGVAEGKIQLQTMSTIFRPLGQRGDDGKWHAKSQPSAEDLRASILLARGSADQAGIPDEPWKLDVAEAVIDMIDRAVGPAR